LIKNTTKTLQWTTKTCIFLNEKYTLVEEKNIFHVCSALKSLYKYRYSDKNDAKCVASAVSKASWHHPQATDTARCNVTSI